MHKGLIYSSFSLVGLCLVLHFLVSCGENKKNALPALAKENCIIGGRPVDPSSDPCHNSESLDDPWKNTIALVSRTGGKQFCSGVLIHPQIALTAAHCLPETPAEMEFFIKDTKIHVGYGKDEGLFSGQHSLKFAQRHPNYLQHYQGNADIAFLYLETPLTDVPIIPYLWRPQDLWEGTRPGKKVRIVGFGLRDNNNPKAIGLKYQVDVPVIKNTSQEFSAGMNNKDACRGDSGGPVFVRDSLGQWKLLGLTSRGGNPCGLGHDSPGQYSLLFSSLCFISKALSIPLEGAQNNALDCLLMTENRPSTPQILPGDHFISLCLKSPPQLSEETLHTLTVLKRLVKEDDCLKAFEKLLPLKKISLAGQFITDLSPLIGLEKLEELDLQDNFIQQLTPLSYLPHLKEVRIDLNPHLSVRDVEDIEQRHQRTIFHISLKYFAAVASMARVDLLEFYWKRLPPLALGDEFLNIEGRKALEVAVKKDQIDKVKFLLEKHIPATIPMANSTTFLPLMHLAKSVSMINFLHYQNGHLMAEKHPQKLTNVLMVQAQFSRPEVLQKILELGGQHLINQQDSQKWSPLMYAAKSGPQESVEILCRHGANKELKNDKGQNAADIAASFKQMDIYQYLIDFCYLEG